MLFSSHSQHQFFLNMLFKMALSIPNEIAWILSTYFHAKMTKFTSGSEPNEAFEVTISNSYSWQKNGFQQYTICLCLKLFAKVTFFEIVVQGQPRLRIRIQNYSQTQFEPTNLMAALELANQFLLKIIFFLGKHYCNTPFIPSDVKSVNEMSRAFKTLLRNFYVNIILTFKTPF